MSCRNAGRRRGTTRRARSIDRRLAMPRRAEVLHAEEWRTLSRGVRRASCRSRRTARRSGRRRLSIRSSTDGDARRLPLRRDAAAGRGVAARAARRWTQEARQATARRSTNLPDARTRTRCSRRMQKGELTGGAWGGMPSQAFFEHRVIPRHRPRLLRAPDRLERDRLRRPGQPARLCPDGFRTSATRGRRRRSRTATSRAARRKNRHVG